MGPINLTALASIAITTVKSFLDCRALSLSLAFFGAKRTSQQRAGNLCNCAESLQVFTENKLKLLH